MHIKTATYIVGAVELTCAILSIIVAILRLAGVDQRLSLTGNIMTAAWMGLFLLFILFTIMLFYGLLYNQPIWIRVHLIASAVLLIFVIVYAILAAVAGSWLYFSFHIIFFFELLFLMFVEYRCYRYMRKFTLADLNHVQRDSQSEVVDLRYFLPDFCIESALPPIRAFSFVIGLIVFGIEIAICWRKRERLVVDCILIFVWCQLWILHSISGNRFLEREDLYVMQLVSSMVALVSSICSMALIGGEEGPSPDVYPPAATFDSQSSISPMPSCKFKRRSSTAASVATLHTINQNRSHGGMIQKRRHQRDSSSPGRVGKLLTSMRLAEEHDDDNRSELSGARTVTSFQTDATGRKPFVLAPSRFQSVAPSMADALTSDRLSSIGDDISYATSSYGSPPSIVGSMYSRVSPEIVSDDALSMFSSVSRRYAPSTAFYGPSSMISSVGPPVSECKQEITTEWTWKIIAGVILFLSLFSNAAVVGYLLTTCR